MKSKTELDEFTLKYLEKLLSKDALDLSKGEREFINARRLYLSGDEKEKFASILKEDKEEKPKVK